VAQARAPRGDAALAMVVRTRFYSAKGQLLRCARVGLGAVWWLCRAGSVGGGVGVGCWGL